MDKTLTVALGGLLAAGAAVGAYKTGVIGPQYAEVVRSTPVTVKEPLYADVVDTVPITQTTESPQRVCHTETRTREKTIGYEVRYIQDGQLKTMRVSKKPSDQVWLGDRSRIIGYDVDWRYRDKSGTVRLDDKPGEHLPIRDGAIVIERRIAAN
jgi:uncharacterized protein YcfJ